MDFEPTRLPEVVLIKPPSGQWVGVELTADNHHMLWMPPKLSPKDQLAPLLGDAEACACGC